MNNLNWIPATNNLEHLLEKPVFLRLLDESLDEFDSGILLQCGETDLYTRYDLVYKGPGERRKFRFRRDEYEIALVELDAFILPSKFHPEFQVGDRVGFRGLGTVLDHLQGRITGLASSTLLINYIVTLDLPVQVGPLSQKPWETVSMSGTNLFLV